jgi:hypothetical protein
MNETCCSLIDFGERNSARVGKERETQRQRERERDRGISKKGERRKTETAEAE